MKTLVSPALLAVAGSIAICVWLAIPPSPSPTTTTINVNVEMVAPSSGPPCDQPTRDKFSGWHCGSAPVDPAVQSQIDDMLNRMKPTPPPLTVTRQHV